MPKPRVKAGTSKSAAAERRKKFALAYIANGRNATQAAITAGFSPNGADAVGARLSGDVRVSALIAELTEKHSVAAGLTVERSMTEQVRAAYGEPADELTWAAKLKALDMANRIHGLYAADNKQKAPNIAIQVVFE